MPPSGVLGVVRLGNRIYGVFFRRAGDHHDVLALEGLALDGGEEGGQRAAVHLLEELGEVVGEGGGAVAQDGERVLQEGGEAERP